MAVEMWIRGSWYPTVSGYTAVEDATPTEPGSSRGGYGQISVTAPSNLDTKTLWNEEFKLRDTKGGEIYGIIRSGGSSNGTQTATLDGDSRLALAAVRRKIGPYTGTLSGAFRAYLAAVKLTKDVVIDPVYDRTQVSLQGFDDEVGFRLKSLATAYGAELSYVGRNIVIRPVRKNTAVDYRDSTLEWIMDTSQVAQSVEVKYYNNTQRTNSLAYPPGGWTPESDVEVFQVDAGETLRIPLEINASLSSVVQPVCVSWMGPTTANVSGYTVTGEGDKPITPDQWRATGGSVKIEIDPDSLGLTMVLVGASEQRFAPYRLAMSSGSSNTYSSLRILGTGVFFTEKSIIVGTGVDPDIATQEVGIVVENRAITTEKQARDLAVATVNRWTGPSLELSVTSKGINRLGDTGSYRFPTFKEFNDEQNAKFPKSKFSDFNARNAGKKFKDFNAERDATVADDFENQAFGNVAGARKYHDFGFYRIYTATHTPSSLSYSAEMDTIFKDFNQRWAGTKFADFNKQWKGKKFRDNTVRPLFRDPVIIDVTAPWPDTFYPDQKFPR